MKKKTIEFVCQDCGNVAEPIEKTGNWDKMPTSCAHCGGKFRIIYEVRK